MAGFVSLIEYNLHERCHKHKANLDDSRGRDIYPIISENKMKNQNPFSPFLPPVPTLLSICTSRCVALSLSLSLSIPVLAAWSVVTDHDTESALPDGKHFKHYHIYKSLHKRYPPGTTTFVFVRIVDGPLHCVKVRIRREREREQIGQRERRRDWRKPKK